MQFTAGDSSGVVANLAFFAPMTSRACKDIALLDVRLIAEHHYSLIGLFNANRLKTTPATVFTI
jgi:hypothetical protein